MADRPIHLEIEQPHMENQEIIDRFRLTQSEIDGLNTLLNWCEGFMAGKGGQVPGFYDTHSLYRSLCSHIRQQRKDNKKQEE